MSSNFTVLGEATILTPALGLSGSLIFILTTSFCLWAYVKRQLPSWRKLNSKSVLFIALRSLQALLSLLMFAFSASVQVFYLTDLARSKYSDEAETVITKQYYTLPELQFVTAVGGISFTYSLTCLVSLVLIFASPKFNKKRWLSLKPNQIGKIVAIYRLFVDVALAFCMLAAGVGGAGIISCLRKYTVNYEHFPPVVNTSLPTYSVLGNHTHNSTFFFLRPTLPQKKCIAFTAEADQAYALASSYYAFVLFFVYLTSTYFGVGAWHKTVLQKAETKYEEDGYSELWNLSDDEEEANTVNDEILFGMCLSLCCVSVCMLCVSVSVCLYVCMCVCRTEKEDPAAA